MVNSPPIRAGVKSSFAGKNGGDANDAELLALLKGISSGSNGTASNTPSPVAASPPPPPPTADDVVDDDSKALPPPPPEPKPAPLPAAQAPTTTVPTPDDGSSTFDPTSSNWKVRKSSYEVINSHLSAHPDAPPFATSSLKIEGCATPLDLDSCLPSYLQDSNAATLDSAVSLALSYARVSSAVHSSSAGCVPGLCSSLVSHAFASSRPSTAKTSRLLAAALCTNCPTPSNLCTLSTTLLSLPTKNPKVHASCVDTLLHLSSLYGAHLLPLSAVSSRAPAILGHPDGRVRSSCVELLAAVETACGPSVLAAVVSGMKDQQERQFRATVESRPRPGRAKEDVPWGGDKRKVEDALRDMEMEREKVKEEESREREPVELVELLKGSTEYNLALTSPKWSVIVAGLNSLISLAGPSDPYKLSPSSDYGPLFGSLGGLLSHTHSAVASKAMECLSVLFSGLGPHAHSLSKKSAASVLSRSSDKKLASAALRCLAKCSRCNALGLQDALDACDRAEALTSKNATKRRTGHCWLRECAELESSSSSSPPSPHGGRRFGMDEQGAKKAAEACAGALRGGEADKDVKAAIVGTLRALLLWEEGEGKGKGAVRAVVDGLRGENERAWKAVVGGGDVGKDDEVQSQTQQQRAPAPAPAPRPRASDPGRARDDEKASAAAEPDPPAPKKREEEPDVEDYLSALSALGVPNFEGEGEGEDSCVRSRLTDSKWQGRKSGLDALASFLSSSPGGGCGVADNAAPAFVKAVRSASKDLKDSNFNVMLSAYSCLSSLVLAVGGAKGEGGGNGPPSPAPAYLLGLCARAGVEKAADKKLGKEALGLLGLALRAARPGQRPAVVEAVASALKKVKSPAAQEQSVKALEKFVDEVGAKRLTVEGLRRVADLAVSAAAATSNAKVKAACASLVGAAHRQVGLPFAAVVNGLAKKAGPALAKLVEEAIERNPHDEASAPKAAEGEDEDEGQDEAFDLPRNDLMSGLAKDVLEKLGRTEGKNAWKARKEALEAVQARLKKDDYLIKPGAAVLDLLRGLKGRLSDSQSNLKPLAAAVIADVVFSLDASTAAKYVKVVGPALVSLAVNDNKKMMRDAVFSALKRTLSCSAEPGKVNGGVLNSYLSPLAQAIKEGGSKPVGLAEVLAFYAGTAAAFSKFDPETASTKQIQLEQSLCMELLNCLCSAKADVRGESEKLISQLLENAVITVESLNRALGKLKPAQQRDAGSVVTKICKGSSAPAPASKPSATMTSTGRRQSVEKKRPKKVAQPAAPRPQTDANTGAAPAAHDISPNSHPFFGGAHVQNYSYGREYAAYSAGKEQRVCSLFRKKENWPEFPELPHALTFSSTLTKNWSPLLNPSAASAFFPATGMKKQDEAIAGCQIISKAVTFELENSLVRSHICDQLDLILKWLACALCAKDHTSGLEAVLNASCDMFDFLVERGYELMDVEAKCFIPIVVEKSAVAKGRFVDKFASLLSKTVKVQSTKSFGHLCVSILDHSKNQKARARALIHCKDCVRTGGLGSIGKKGLHSVVRALDGTVSDVREASLNVCEAALVKLSGDKDKLFRLCGSALTARGQSLVVERAKRLEASGYPTGEDIDNADTSFSVDKHPATSTPGRRGSHTQASTPKTGSATKRGSLDLRIGEQSMLTSPLKGVGGDVASPSGPFKFVSNNVATSSVLTPTRRSSLEKETAPSPQREQEQEQEREQEETSVTVTSPTNTTMGGEGVQAVVQSGAAASLRARLAAIRGRNRNSSTGSSNSDASAKTALAIANANAAVQGMLSQEINEMEGGRKEKEEVAVEKKVEEEEEVKKEPAVYSAAKIYKDIRTLIKLPSVPEEDEKAFKDGKEALKVVHYAITGKKSVGVGDVSEVVEGYLEKPSKCVEVLASVFKFSFKSEELCVPLLSITLACLMAVFRGDMSRQIDQPTLQFLLAECCKGLLDVRLSSAVKGDPTFETQSQIVRAVNKLTIQSAVTSSRTVSVQCLLSLHLKLMKEKDLKTRKVVAKLLGKVTKAEAVANPASPFGLFGPELVREGGEVVDIEAVVCCLEDFLVECANNLEKAEEEEGRKIGRGLILSIVGSGEGKNEREGRLRKVMLEDLEFDSDANTVALLSECVGDVQMADMFPAVTPAKPKRVVVEEQQEVFSTPVGIEKGGQAGGRGGILKTPGLRSVLQTPARFGGEEEEDGDDDDLAMLVADIGSAVTGPAKSAAVKALKDHAGNKCMGVEQVSKELDLMGLSTPFKAFVVSGLEGDGGAPKGDESKENVAGPGGGGGNNVVSDRIADLKKRLVSSRATGLGVKEGDEAAVKVEDKVAEETGEGEKVEPTETSSAGVLSLRERLAAVKRRGSVVK